LRHCMSASFCHHFPSLVGVTIHRDFLKGHFFVIQQGFGSHTVGTKPGGVQQDRIIRFSVNSHG
jgi:hypothetical protein